VDLFHRSNFIEKLGTGLLRIDSELEKAGLPKAEFEINDHWFSIIFKRKYKIVDEEQQNSFDGLNLSEQGENILSYCSETPRSRTEIFDFLQMSNETRNFNRHVLPLLNSKLIIMTLPAKPRSMNQRYITTDLGRKLLKNH